MLCSFAYRLLTSTSPRLLAKFGWNLGVKGLWAVQRFKRRLKRGEVSPAFWMLSITNACNYRCQGCWVSVDAPRAELSPEDLDRIIVGATSKGGSFFGILGGEPLLHKGLWDVLRRHPGCYFQIFTNGVFLTPEVAKTMRALGNVTPLISFEGKEAVADERRGGRNVQAAALRAIENCRAQRLITGVATSLCQSNLKQLLSEAYVDEMLDLGVHYLWYYAYRPVGPQPTPELTLTKEQLVEVRRFTVDIRCRKPIMIVDAYWDDRGRALCPAAVGISHHIGPWGDIEPCPVVQFAGESVRDGDVGELAARSEFLGAFRALATKTTRGCVMLERPDLLRELVQARQARDSTGRGTGLKELAAMQPRPSHDVNGCEIPEKHWAYRLAKRYWFFGFGAYG